MITIEELEEQLAKYNRQFKNKEYGKAQQERIYGRCD